MNASYWPAHSSAQLQLVHAGVLLTSSRWHLLNLPTIHCSLTCGEQACGYRRQHAWSWLCELYDSTSSYVEHARRTTLDGTVDQQIIAACLRLYLDQARIRYDLRSIIQRDIAVWPPIPIWLSMQRTQGSTTESTILTHPTGSSFRRASLAVFWSGLSGEIHPAGYTQSDKPKCVVKWNWLAEGHCVVGRCCREGMLR